MLKTRLELDKWLKKKYGDEELYLNTVKAEDIRMPGRYEGFNVRPASEYLEIWDSVGCMVEVIGIYRPASKKGGTRLYDVEGVYRY